MTQVSEISEFELIARLENILKLSSNIPDAQIKFAIGDDAAVVTPNSKNQVITSDALVEKRVKVIYALEPKLHDVIIYPLASLNKTRGTMRFIGYLYDKKTLNIMSKWGFKIKYD